MSGVKVEAAAVADPVQASCPFLKGRPRSGRKFKGHLSRLGRKRKGPKRTRMLAWVRHNCNGNMHCVGLTTKGQLVFSHHTMAEIKRWRDNMAMGDTTCRCAAIYEAWRLGKRDANLPVALAQERHVWNRYDKKGQDELGRQLYQVLRPAEEAVLAARLMHKRRLKRDTDSYQGSLYPLPLAGAGTAGGVGEAAIKQANHTIVHLLRSWGWNFEGKPKLWKSRAPRVWAGTQGYVMATMPYIEKDPDHNGVSPEEGHPQQLLRATTRQGLHPHVRYHVPGTVYETDATINSTNRGCWDLRRLADLAEMVLLRTMIDRHRRAAKGAAVRHLHDLARQLSEDLGHNHFAVTADPHKATFDLRITFNNLTRQAAEKLARLIRDATGFQMLKAIKVSEIRQNAALRTPPLPGEAVGTAPFTRNPAEEDPL